MATGLQKLLVVLEGEPFEEILAQPSLGTSQPAEVGQVQCQVQPNNLVLKPFMLPQHH